MAISAIGAAVATVGSYAAGTLIAGSIMTTFAVNFALSAVGKALMPKPETPSYEPTDNTLTVKSPIATRSIVYGRSRVGGTLVYLDTTGEENKYLHMVIALATHEIDAIEKVYFGDNLAWENGNVQGDYVGYADFRFHDGTQTEHDSVIASRCTTWGENHILNGIAYLYVRLKYDTEVYTSGIPNISAVVRGKPLYDPRDGSTSYSTNPALAIYDYLKNDFYGMNASDDEIHLQSFKDAADLCDSLVGLGSGDIETRYTISGVIDTADTPKNIITGLLTSLGGQLTYTGGQFHLQGAEWIGPEYSINENDITGAITVQTKVSRRETFNAVKGVFSSIPDNFTLADYPPVISSTYELQDGDPSYLDVPLAFTTSPTMAQRLAKLSLLKSRQQITAQIPCTLAAMKFKAGDVITVDNTRLGWSGKEFEVTGWKFSYTTDGTLGVDLAVRETGEAIYDWETSEEREFVAGVATNLPLPSVVGAPSNLTLASSVQIGDDGTLRPYIDITWTNTDAFASQFEIEYTVGSQTRTVLTTGSEYRLYDIVVGQVYTIKVRAINRLGARSIYVSGTSTGAGDTSGPSAPSDLTVTGIIDGLQLDWTNPTDSDFDIVQIYEGTSSVRNDATLIATARASSFARMNVTGGATRFYWLRAVDYTGNQSDWNADEGVSGTSLIPIDESDIVGTIEVVDALTNGLGTADKGKVEFLNDDQKLYRWTGTEWVTGVSIDDVEGSVTASKISAATLSSIAVDAGTITAGKLQDDPDNPEFIIDLNNKFISITV